ncbi:hypothetical protein IM538_21745 [Cytobacillus suaedae]|nr:hypothetical protein IM538_21745 [Cytobacillus suaedae]
MAYKRLKLNNTMQEAFSVIYEDINSLAYLATKECELSQNLKEIDRIKNNIKQNIKAIEFLTTTQN